MANKLQTIEHVFTKSDLEKMSKRYGINLEKKPKQQKQKKEKTSK